MSRIGVGWMVVVLCAVGLRASAADGPPGAEALGEHLSRCDHAALVKLGARRKSTVRAEVAHDVTGIWPPALTLVHDGTLPKLDEGDLALAVVCTPEGPQADRPTAVGAPLYKVRRGLIRPVQAFVGDWRAEAQGQPTERLDAWLGLLSHPWAPAREAAFKQLVDHREQLRGRLGERQIATLAEILVGPERAEGVGVMVIRVLTRLAGKEGANQVGVKLPYIRGRRAQREAVMALARYPTAENRRALERCGQAGSSVMAAHCRRALMRIPGGAKGSAHLHHP